MNAQEAMARWTFVMGGVAGIGLFISIVGVGLVYITFQETRRAADAGFDANQIARESSERQLRAYVGIETGGLEEGNPWPTARVYLRNFGQTPAYEFRASIVAVARPRNHRVGLDGVVNPEAVPMDLMPQQGYMLVAEELTGSPTHFDNNLTIYVLVGIEFVDAFGERHEKRVAMIRSGKEGLRPYPCEDVGNDGDCSAADG